MSKKQVLIEKLCGKPMPKNFTVWELDSLMSMCGCIKGHGGRGSAVRYFHAATGKILQFDRPHPGKELYAYQIKMVVKFLKMTSEIKDRGESAS